MSKFNFIRKWLATSMLALVIAQVIPALAFAEGGQANLVVSNIGLDVVTNSYITVSVTNLGGTDGIDLTNPVPTNDVTVDGVYITSFEMDAFAEPNLLHAGETQEYVTNVQLTPGNHLVAICTDTWFSVAESDDNDNCLSQILTVASVGTPDLVVSSVSSDGAVLYFSLANQGDGDVTADTNLGTSVVGTSALYFGSGSVADYAGTNDYFLAGQTSNFQVPLTMVNGDSVTVCADFNNDVVENDDANNCFTYTYGPDLALAPLLFLDPIGETLTYFVVNLGGTDALYDPSMLGSNSFTVNGRNVSNSWNDAANMNFLIAGGATTGFTVDVSNELNADPYQLLIDVCLDDSGVIAESDETNNCTNSTITLREPLPAEIIDLTAGPLGFDSANQIFGYSPTNDSNLDAYSPDAGYNSISINGGEPTLYPWADLPDNNFLKANGMSGFTVDLSAEMAQGGSFTVEVCIDTTNVIAEVDETNNCNSATYVLPVVGSLPDLAITGVHLIDWGGNEIPSGTDMTNADPTLYLFTYDLVNNGVAVDPALVTTRALDMFYYIDNNVAPQNFRPIRSYRWPDHADTAFLSEYGFTNGIIAVGVTWPARFRFERMYSEVQVCTDFWNVVPESKEDNNCMIVENPFYKAPDFTVSDVTLASDGTLVYSANNSGSTLQYPYVVTNQIYVDGVLSDTFNLDNTAEPNVLHFGETQTQNTAVQLTVPGTYTVYACVDTTNVFTEADETNNCMTKYLTVLGDQGGDEGNGGDEGSTNLPDLALNSLTVASTYVQIDVSNDGLADMNLGDQPSVEVKLNGSSVFTDLMSNYGTAFATQGASSSMVLPVSGLTSGEVQVCVDSANNVVEAKEDNNCAIIQYSAPEVVVPPVVTTPPVDGGVPLGVGGQGGNGGSSTSSQSNSSDILISDDVILTEDEIAVCGEMTFTDVSVDAPYYDAIYSMWCQGVIHGKTATEFAPEDSVMRDEASKIISRLFGFVTMAHSDLPEVTETSYTDVSTNEPLAYYVETLTDEGYYTAEEEEGTFRPHEAMTGEEIANILSEVTGNEVTFEESSDDSMSRGGFVNLVLSLFE